MCSRNFPVQKCLSALAVPDVTEVITGVIRIICPLPGPRYLSQPVRDMWALRGAVRVHDVSIQCIQNKTFFFFISSTEISFSVKVSAHRRQLQATKEEGAAAFRAELCSCGQPRAKRRGQAGSAGCRQKTSRVVFSRNTIYSPLSVTSGQG